MFFIKRNISKWNICNVIDFNALFYKCSSIKEIPDISKWNTGNINDMSYSFAECL